MAYRVYEENKKETKKEWALKTHIDNLGTYTTSAVDAETGEHIAYLFSLIRDGSYVVIQGASCLFTAKGYDPSPLQFDENGALKKAD